TTSTSSSPSNRSETSNSLQPGMTTAAYLTSMVPASISDTMRSWEDSFPSSPPPNTIIKYTTPITTTSLNEGTTRELSVSSIRNRSTIGRVDTSRNGSDEALAQTWSTMPPGQAYLDMNLYHLFPSLTETTLDTGCAPSTGCTPYTTTVEEEWLPDIAWWNSNPSGEETMTVLTTQSDAEERLGSLPDGLWASNLYPSSEPIQHTETASTPTSTYLRHRRASQEPVSDPLLMEYDGLIPTEEELRADIDQLVGIGCAEETELPEEEDQEDQCDGQRTCTLVQNHTTALEKSQSLTIPQTTTNTTVEEEETEGEGSVVGREDVEELEVEPMELEKWENSGVELVNKRGGSRSKMTWEEGFKRAKRNLKKEFDLAEAYSLGKVIVNGNKKNSKLALQYLGKWWKRVVIAVYKLNKDNEADLEELSPTTYYHMSRQER
ncbi:2304_t:CDS:2, partial [Paraglomus brasilianum]